MLLAIPVLSLFSGGLAHANPFIITQPTDVWFDYSETTQFVTNTVMIEGFPSDPQLWLYDEEGTLIVSNDDFNGLQSHISVELQAGRYRLRAGTCCGEPDVWRGGGGWNEQYELLFNGQQSAQTTVPVTVIPEETTTTSSTSTTSTTTSSTSTTTSSTSTTTSSTSTTLPISTTTSSTSTTSTTTSSTSTTVEPTTTTILPETTTSTSIFTPFVNSTTTTDAMHQTTTSLQTTTTSVVASTTTSTTPQNAFSTPISNVFVTAAISQLTSIDPEKVTLTDLQSVLDPKVTAQMDAAQVNAIVDVIAQSVDNLSETELVILADALSSAPSAVKQSFEEKIDIFSGKFNTYVPTGSKVNVEKRRVLNAVVATIMAVPVAVGTNPKRKIL